MDLSPEGSKVSILGYELRLCNGKPTYGIPETAWRDLDNQLIDAYSAEHPGRIAETMVRGWIQGYRLAFENVASKRKKELIQRLLNMLAAKGFREVSGKEVNISFSILFARAPHGSIQQPGLPYLTPGCLSLSWSVRPGRKASRPPGQRTC